MSAPALKKEVSLTGLFALSFGSMIGIGWITVLGAWVTQAGALGAALAFLIGAVIVTLIALCYAEMATRFPATGGEIVYIHEMFGLNAAFVGGWLLIMGYVSVVVFEAISVGWIISALVPALTGPVLYSVGTSDVTLGGLTSGIAGMVLIAWFNIRGAKTASSVQQTLTFLLIVVTVVFCFAAFVRGDFANLDPAFVANQAGSYWPGILAVLITVPFWFSGFDVVPQAMGERSAAASLKFIPLVLLLSIFAAALFYVVIVLAATTAVPRDQLLSADLPVAEAITVALGSTAGGKLVLFAGLLGLLTSWNSFTYGAARVLFALGRANIVFPFFGHIDDRHRTPKRAILLISVFGIFGNFFGKGAIVPVVDTGSVAFTLVYAAVCIAALRAGFLAKAPSGFRAPLGPLVRLAAVAITMGMAVYALYIPYDANLGTVPVEWLLFALWLVLGAVFYSLSAKMRSQMSAADRSSRLLTEVV